MKIHTTLQGTPEWLESRKGKITGTDAAAWMLDPKPCSLTIDKIKGILDGRGESYKKSLPKGELLALLPDASQYSELSTAARNLLIGKLDELKAKDVFQVAQSEKEQRQMESMFQIARGNQLEPLARQFYEMKTGLTTREVGFVESDCGTYGMSPDGLVMAPDGLVMADNVDGVILGGVEIKCPWPETHQRWILEHYMKGTVPAEHFYQCQMGLAVTGAQWWDFLSFCPLEAPLLTRIYRDEITEALVAGLAVLREERDVIEDFQNAIWNAEMQGENERLLSYPNGQAIYAPDGSMLDAMGDPIVFEVPTWRAAK